MTPKYQGRFGDSLMFSMGECKILVSGPQEREQIGWHFSISHTTRNGELVNLSSQFVPDPVGAADKGG